MADNWSDFEKNYFSDALEEFTTIIAVWYQWEALFEQDVERLSQMQKFGNLLFGSIERVFYRDVALGICRLTDPVEQGRNTNITIIHFKGHMYQHDLKLKSLVEDAQAKAEPFKNWRNKRLAHLDAQTGVGWHPPQGCERGAISNALQALSAVFRHVSAAFGAKELLLGDRPGRQGDARVQNCPLRMQIRPQIERIQNHLCRAYEAPQNVSPAA